MICAYQCELHYPPHCWLRSHKQYTSDQAVRCVIFLQFSKRNCHQKCIFGWENIDMFLAIEQQCTQFYVIVHSTRLCGWLSCDYIRIYCYQIRTYCYIVIVVSNSPLDELTIMLFLYNKFKGEILTCFVTESMSRTKISCSWRIPAEW